MYTHEIEKKRKKKRMIDKITSQFTLPAREMSTTNESLAACGSNSCISLQQMVKFLSRYVSALHYHWKEKLSPLFWTRLRLALWNFCIGFTILFEIGRAELWSFSSWTQNWFFFSFKKEDWSKDLANSDFLYSFELDSVRKFVSYWKNAIFFWYSVSFRVW